jgi:hypothetical protein
MHLDAAGMCKFGDSYDLVLGEYGPVKGIFQSNYFSRGANVRVSPSEVLTIGKLAQQMNVSGNDDIILNVRKGDVMS